MEERVGERRHVYVVFPLSSILSPLLRRGERKKNQGLIQWQWGVALGDVL
jgi:hypothetical protein